MEDLIKENLGISGKKQQKAARSGVIWFVLKEQRQDINEDVKEMLRRHHERLIKRKRGKDKYNQEGGTTFTITTTAAVQELCMVKDRRARERDEAEDKGKREKIQASANRAKKKHYLPPPFSLGQICKKSIF